MDEIEGILSETPKVAAARLRGIEEKRDFTKELEKKVEDFYANKKVPRMIMLYGLRGTGKTISLLQIYTAKKESAMYLSCDDLLKNNIRIGEAMEKVDILFKERVGLNKKFLLLLDEVSYLPNWQLELKLLYDKRPNIMVIATSSSSVALYSTELERRAAEMRVSPFTFREYLKIKKKIAISDELSQRIRKKIFGRKEEPTEEFFKVLSIIGEKSLISLYRDYIMEDMPISLELEGTDYFAALNNMIKKVIYEDFPKYANVESELLIKAEQTINYISRVPADGVRVEKISETLGISKYSTTKLLTLLSNAMLIKGVEAYGRNRAFKLAKKWFFLSPSIRYALARPLGLESDIRGNMREDSVFMHLNKLFQNIYYSKEADFVVPNIIGIEVGGKKAGRKGTLTLVEEEVIGGGRVPIPIFLLSV
jgi:predicted AAA+ superfamily ATPase